MQKAAPERPNILRGYETGRPKLTDVKFPTPKTKHHGNWKNDNAYVQY